MKVLIIGSGISGMMCAIRCAMHNIHAVLISPSPSERSQSVMAAGGINAVVSECEDGDSIACHISDTLRGGSWLGGPNAVSGLCSHAEEIIRYLESNGTVFSVDADNRPLMRAFGGQSHKRTHYCGSSTGGQNVLFGKTTGTNLCDGYAAGKLFMQGALLKNLEFIQYHPTTLETSQKRMLTSAISMMPPSVSNAVSALKSVRCTLRRLRR
ncbi:MAG: FAD-binding protein [Spirochaetales bacterium]|nr:FAD-binding protein [Spirochaetales bacterium]